MNGINLPCLVLHQSINHSQIALGQKYKISGFRTRGQYRGCSRTDEEQKKRRKSQESRDEALARKLQVEYDRKFRLLEAQKDAEDRAETQGLYAKKQRVSYIHRGTNTQYDAMIVGVHFDDGPDKPYYVSKKNRHPFEDFFQCLFVRSF